MDWRFLPNEGAILPLRLWGLENPLCQIVFIVCFRIFWTGSLSCYCSPVVHELWAFAAYNCHWGIAFHFWIMKFDVWYVLAWGRLCTIFFFSYLNSSVLPCPFWMVGELQSTAVWAQGRNSHENYFSLTYLLIYIWFSLLPYSAAPAVELHKLSYFMQQQLLIPPLSLSPFQANNVQIFEVSLLPHPAHSLKNWQWSQCLSHQI